MKVYKSKKINKDIQVATVKIIELPDGYNGDTELFFSPPIETNGPLVKLRCATPGKEYLFRWAYKSDVEDQLKESE